MTTRGLRNPLSYILKATHTLWKINIDICAYYYYYYLCSNNFKVILSNVRYYYFFILKNDVREVHRVLKTPALSMIDELWFALMRRLTNMVQRCVTCGFECVVQKMLFTICGEFSNWILFAIVRNKCFFSFYLWMNGRLTAEIINR